MLALIARFLGLALAGICIYLLAKETGILHDLWCWIQDNATGVTSFFADIPFQRSMMAGVYLIGAIAGLLLFVFANRRD